MRGSKETGKMYWTVSGGRRTEDRQTGRQVDTGRRWAERVRGIKSEQKASEQLEVKKTQERIRS